MSHAASLTDAPPAPAGGARGRRRQARGGLPFGGGSGTSLGLVVLWVSILVVLPLAAVVGTAFENGLGEFWSTLTDSTNRDALLLTLVLALGVAVINAVVGTAIAWVLVRERFRGVSALEFVIDIPFALPTIVAGTVMLAVYGDDGVSGVSLAGTRTGLLVTLLFVTLPFVVRTAQPVLVELDREAEQAAASLGASPVVVFRRVILPQLLPAVASGAALAFARALGEFGSLVFLSSNLPHKTLIASSLIYGLSQSTDANADQQASTLATALLLASAVVLVLLEVLQRRVARRG